MLVDLEHARSLAMVAGRYADCEDALERARQAHDELQQDPWDVVSEARADRDILSLPSSLLPVAKLRGYLGPSLTEGALSLPEGGFSPPQQEQAGYTILQLIAHQPGVPPRLTAIREQVAREFQRRAGDQALRDYLSLLKRGADIDIDEAFLEEVAALNAPP